MDFDAAIQSEVWFTPDQWRIVCVTNPQGAAKDCLDGLTSDLEKYARDYYTLHAKLWLLKVQHPELNPFHVLSMNAAAVVLPKDFAAKQAEAERLRQGMYEAREKGTQVRKQRDAFVEGLKQHIVWATAALML